MSGTEETQLKIQGNEVGDDSQKIKASASKSTAARKLIKDDDEGEDNMSLANLHSNKKKPVSDSKAKGNVKVSKVKKEDIYDSEDRKGNEVGDDSQKTNTSASKSSAARKIIKDDDDDEDNMSLANLHSNKKKPVGDSKAKANVKMSKVKKEDLYDSEDEKPKAKVKVRKGKKEEKIDSEEEMDDKKLVHKVEKKVKKVKKEVNTKTKVSREKKVYSLPGQKHDPPQERDPLRIFYESLYQQVPTSEMAAIWMMEWGLLSESEAEKVYNRKIKMKDSHKLKSPSQTVVTTKKTATVTVREVKKTKTTKSSSKTPKKRKVSDSEDDADDDFVASIVKNKTKK